MMTVRAQRADEAQVSSRAHRVDRGVRIKPTIDPASGYLRVDARLTRVGVFAYVLDDGTIRREFRSAGEVFADKSIDSLRSVPVTNDHPTTPVNASNAVQFAKGSVGENVERDGDYVSASVAVWDAALIKLVQDGKQELSCGYACDVVFTPGMWNGIPYDAEQKNIMYNHVAVVDNGRAGPQVRLRYDGDQVVLIGEPAEPEERKIMELEEILAMFVEMGAERSDAAGHVKIGGKKFDLSKPEGRKAAREALKAAEAEARSAGKEKPEAKGDAAAIALVERMDRLEGSLAEAKKGREEAEAKLAKHEAQQKLDAETKAKAELEQLKERAKKLAPQVKLDSCSDATAVQRAVLIERQPEAERTAYASKLDAEGAAMIGARFRILEEQPNASAGRNDTARATGNAVLQARGQAQQGTQRVDADQARAAYIDRLVNKTAPAGAVK